MLGNAATTSARSRSDSALTKTRSRPERARYNGRSREARLVRALAGELTAALGDVPLNPIITAAVLRAAELGVIAADLRARRLRGEPVNVFELVRAENAHRRAVRDLGVLAAARREPGPQPLAEYLRETERGDG